MVELKLDVQDHQLQSDQLKRKRPRKFTTKDGLPKTQKNIARRSSMYRGVTRHKWTGRYEAHLWDKSCWNQSQNKKGRQVYLGAYVNEEAAARAYDLAALKYWGPGTTLNFPLSIYANDLEEMQGITKEEYLASLRRKSSGFSRGVSKYRGVARHHHNGRWEARIGRIFGNKYLYLGTYSTQEEAAAAYDLAAIEYRGLNAVTNFDLSRYVSWLKPGQGGLQKTELLEQSQHAGLKKIKKSSRQDSPNTVTLNTQSDVTRSPNEAAITRQQSFGGPTTALGLLLQSAKFKEMLERTSMDQPVKNATVFPKQEPQAEEDISYMNFDFFNMTEDQEVPLLCSSSDFNEFQEELVDPDLSQLLPIPLELSLDPIQWLNE